MTTISIKDEGIKFASRLRLTARMALVRNCEQIDDPQTLYDMSLDHDNVVTLDRCIKNPEKFKLKKGSRQILWNHRNPVGRTAAARQFWHQVNAETRKDLSTLAREAILDLQETGTISTKAYSGLDEEFCVGLRFVSNCNYPIAALSFLLNFQSLTDKIHLDFYKKSRKLDVPDILMIFDPDWYHPDHEKGLVIIDKDSKTIFVLGLPYFGEIKKGFLTLIWQTAISESIPGTGIRRFLPIHGSIFETNNKTVVIIALSGSGKSSLSKNAESIAHDDAFIVSMVTGKAIVLEPTFFNKTDGDKMGDETTERGLIFFNMGVIEKEGKIDVVPGDKLVANGRVIQERPENAIQGYGHVDIVSLVMKDDTLPPISLINDSALFVAFGASLMTKRSLAEALKRIEDQFALVIEPFAQPFRAWGLNTECRMFQLFLKLFKPLTVIMNTGDFMGHDIALKLSHDEILPALTSGDLKFSPWKIVPDKMVSLVKKGRISKEYDKNFTPRISDHEYVTRFVSRMQTRIDFLTNIRGENLLHADFVDPLIQVRIALDEFLKRDPVAGDFSWTEKDIKKLKGGKKNQS